MIRTLKQEDLPDVMDIWLNTNVQAHSFIAREYWVDNFYMVKGMLPKAEVYVYEEDNKIDAFVGLENGYIAGIFVSDKMQSKGIGKLLLGKCKEIYSALSLNVYKKNTKALRFYIREGFSIARHQLDDNTGEVAYLMIWTHEHTSKSPV